MLAALLIRGAQASAYQTTPQSSPVKEDVLFCIILVQRFQIPKNVQLSVRDEVSTEIFPKIREEIVLEPSTHPIPVSRKGKFQILRELRNRRT